MPRSVCFLFGQEGPGLSEQAREACDGTFSIAQFGSTRSINASAAAAIAMHTLDRRGTPTSAPPGGAEPRAVGSPSAQPVGARQRMNRSPARQPARLGGCQKPPYLPISSLQRSRALAVYVAASG